MRFTALLPRQRRALAGVALVAAIMIPLSAGPSAAVQVCNTTPIVFTPPPNPTQSVQPLLPYPSNITVSGQSGTVTDVNVTLNDFSYEFPEDVDVLLVAPNGSRALIMSDLGGQNDVGNATSAIDLTFDDEAPGPPPADTQLSSGTFDPADDDNDPGSFDTTDSFPAPAPGTATVSALSTFDGIAPNGTWSLYVVDDEPGPPVVQQIGGGWCLDITTSAAPTSTTPTTGGPTTSPPTTTGPTTSTTPTTTAPTTSTTPTTTAPTTTTVPPTTTTVPPTTTTVPPTTTTVPPTTTTTTTTPPGTCGGRTPTIVGTSAGETLVGTAGPDVILGGGGGDSIQGLGGNDVICGGPGNDSLVGGAGNDRLFGDTGNDRLLGGDGNDALNGGDQLDQCFGDAGTDTAATCEQTLSVP